MEPAKEDSSTPHTTTATISTVNGHAELTINEKVEEKEVVQKEAMGGVPGVMLEEIRGKRGGKVAVVNVGEVA